MVLLLRTLLVWCMVLLVPAQGTAAVAMAFCASSHPAGNRHLVQAQGQDLGAEAGPEASAHAAHAHHHGEAGQAHEAGAAAAASEPGHTPAGKPLNTDTHSCSACAACCTVGALPTGVMALPSPGFAPTVFAEFVPSVDHFAADGPERPPRPLLA